MALNFSTNPYFDDFSETGNYHRILFKPGFSVQARELNQIQSMLQNQIAKFGSHVFENGSMVIPGDTKVDTNAKYIVLSLGSVDPEIISKLEGNTLVQEVTESSIIRAEVVKAVQYDSLIVAIVVYKNSAQVVDGGEIVSQQNFMFGVPISVEEEPTADILVADAGPEGESYFGQAAVAHVKAGVFFIEGNFVYTEDQTTILSTFTNTPSCRVGFRVVQAVKTAYDDPALFDNAIGSPNESAPGADRLSVELVWESRDLDSTDLSDFVEVMVLEDGELKSHKRFAQYGEIEKTMARRTYDESGDYTLGNFDVKVLDHLKTDTRFGHKTEEEGGSEDKLVVNISPGKAYIRGFEVELLGDSYVEIDKPRGTESIRFADENFVIANKGRYVYVSAGTGHFDIANKSAFFLTKGTENTSDIIGYAIPKYVEADSIGGVNILKVYVDSKFDNPGVASYNVMGGWRFDTDNFGPVLQAIKVYNNNADFVAEQPITSHSGYTVTAWDSTNKILFVRKTNAALAFNLAKQIVTAAASGFGSAISYEEIQNGGEGDIYSLGTSFVKSVKDLSGNVEVQVDQGVGCTITTDASGVGSYTHVGAGSFLPFEIVAIDNTTGEINTTLVTVSGDGRTLNINNIAFANKAFSVSAIFRKTSASIKPKSLATGTTQILESSTAKMVLGHKDVYRIDAIYMSADNATNATSSDQNVTERYSLVSGQTETYYGNDFIQLKPGFPAPKGRLLVQYTYFEHGVGDFFSIDSYVVLRDNINDESDVSHIGRAPEVTLAGETVRLGDVLDFRPRLADGAFIIKAQATGGSATLSVSENYSGVIVAGAKIVGRGISTTVSSVTGNTIVLGASATYSGDVYVIVSVSAATDARNIFRLRDVSAWQVIPQTPIQYDAQFFIGRKDRLILNTARELIYLTGLPGSGSYPDIPQESISLATFDLAPYTLDATEVNYRVDDNKRYTMRDIGRLERRIENLEYYTTLSLKEVETESLKIVDSETGIDRFKSGFFVESFQGQGVASLEDVGFKATINTIVNNALPYTIPSNLALSLNTEQSSGYVIKDGKAYLPYSHQLLVDQPYATKHESVNPFLVLDWSKTARMKLDPARDEWVETQWSPTQTNVTNITRVDTVWANPVLVWADWWAPASTKLVSSTSRTDTSVSSSVRVVGSSILPFMRTRTVRIQCDGMKPDTRYYFAFDGQDVNANVRQVGKGYGQAVISDAMGSFLADFTIPNNRFLSGTRTLRVADVNTIAQPNVGIECEISGNYFSQGIIRTNQQVRNIVNVTTVTNTFREVITSVIQRMEGGDPQAQTFDTFGLSEGYFITKIDLFFQAKAVDAPVILELREVENGTPVSSVMEGGVVVLNPDQVNTSNNSTIATAFEFDAPIFLEPNREYAFVVKSASSRYRTWICRMGEKVVNENRIVGKQPYLGSMFKSQNGTTWTPEQYEDMKFRIYRAKFDTATQGLLTFNNNGSAYRTRITLNSFSTTSGSTTVRAKVENHGLRVNEFVRFDAESVVNETGNSPLGSTLANGIPMSQIYGTKTVTNVVDIDTIEFVVTTAATATGEVDLPGYVWAESNINFNMARLNVDYGQLQRTRVDLNGSFISGKDFSGSQTPGATLATVPLVNDEVKLMSEVGLARSQYNETGTKSVTVTASLSSTSDWVSPVIETRTANATVMSMKLNSLDVDQETSANDGLSGSRYITQVVNLKNVSNKIKVYSAQSKQELDGLSLYIRISSSEADIRSQSWVLVSPVAEATVKDVNDYREYEYDFEPGLEFTSFQMKVVFKSKNSVKYPNVKDLRAIALAA